MIRISKPKYNNKTFIHIKKILESGNLVQGKEVRLFEKKISKFLNIKYSLLVSSGTAALHLSLLALGIKKDDEIIIPSFSYIATANVIELIGAKPILVDINLKDYCIDVKKIEKYITKKTRAIMPVHEFGMPCQIDVIKSIAKKYNLK